MMIIETDNAAYLVRSLLLPLLLAVYSYFKFDNYFIYIKDKNQNKPPP
jgi:hypothetical protein